MSGYETCFILRDGTVIAEREIDSERRRVIVAIALTDVAVSSGTELRLERPKSAWPDRIGAWQEASPDFLDFLGRFTRRYTILKACAVSDGEVAFWLSTTDRPATAVIREFAVSFTACTGLPIDVPGVGVREHWRTMVRRVRGRAREIDREDVELVLNIGDGILPGVGSIFRAILDALRPDF